MQCFEIEHSQRSQALALGRRFEQAIAACVRHQQIDNILGRAGCGVEALMVADASIMPFVPRANTNLTCLMIGEHLAEQIQASL